MENQESKNCLLNLGKDSNFAQNVMIYIKTHFHSKDNIYPFDCGVVRYDLSTANQDIVKIHNENCGQEYDLTTYSNFDNHMLVYASISTYLVSQEPVIVEPNVITCEEIITNKCENLSVLFDGVIGYLCLYDNAQILINGEKYDLCQKNKDLIVLKLLSFCID